MTRLPIRVRLALAFAVAMAVVLAGLGWFVYLRVGSDLSSALDQQLRARAQDVTALVQGGGSLEATGGPLVERGESFAELIAADGRVLDATEPIGEERLVSTSELERAGREPIFVDRSSVPGLDEPARLLALPIERGNESLVLVVGSTSEDRAETLASLRAAILVGGPVVLLLASFLAYAIAGAALRPVEAMRNEATAISGSEPGRRLPLPRAHDEIYRLGETLNRMLERLEAALERERSFVADAGHELRTPLALLKAELELALRRPRTATELQEAIRSAAVETDRLARLAEDLLLLARTDQGQLAIRREPVSAPDLLARIADRFSRRAEADGRTIDVETPGPIALEADSMRLEQAIGNLVENALKHGSGPVQLSASEQDGNVELHVRDEGGGFPPEFLPHAFERFSRADDARAGDGTGLGLTIASVIARAHGGSAHASNRPTGGADVWLSLPGS